MGTTFVQTTILWWGNCSSLLVPNKKCLPNGQSKDDRYDMVLIIFSMHNSNKNILVYVQPSSLKEFNRIIINGLLLRDEKTIPVMTSSTTEVCWCRAEDSAYNATELWWYQHNTDPRSYQSKQTTPVYIQRRIEFSLLPWSSLWNCARSQMLLSNRG